MTSATAATAAIVPGAETAPAHRRRAATSTSPDSTLMARVADGDTAAFEELYRRHGSRVLMQARKLCAGRELAEEVAQEAFLSLWRGAHAYRPAAGSVGGWLSSMVRNRAIDAWRRAAARPVEVEALEDGPGQFRAPARAEPAASERALVLSLIADLPAPQKEAVFLAYFGDMTHAEIASHSNEPLGTIKGRIRLGLEKLRYGFEEQARAAHAQPGPSWPALRAAPPPAGELAASRRSGAETVRELHALTQQAAA